MLFSKECCKIFLEIKESFSVNKLEHLLEKCNLSKMCLSLLRPSFTISENFSFNMNFWRRKKEVHSEYYVDIENHSWTYKKFTVPVSFVALPNGKIGK